MRAIVFLSVISRISTVSPAYRATLLHNLLLCVTSICEIVPARMFGSNWDLVNHQVPFAFPQKDLLCGTIGLHFGFGSNRDLVKHRVPFASNQVALIYVILGSTMDW